MSEKTEKGQTRKPSGMLSIGQKRSAYYVNVEHIRFQEGFNRRSVRTNWETLKQQIKEEGKVLNPITGYYNEGIFYVNHGHGRVSAVRELIEEGIDIEPMIPAEVVAAPNTMEEVAELLARQIIDNSGENFNPIDCSRIVRELKSDYGWNNTKIGGKLGYSSAYIGQLLVLDGLPDELKKLVENGRISATLASEVRMKYKDGATEIIVNAVSNAENRGKSTATRKDVIAVVRDEVKPQPKVKPEQKVNPQPEKLQPVEDNEAMENTEDVEDFSRCTYKKLLEEMYYAARVTGSNDNSVTLSLPKNLYDEMSARFDAIDEN